MAYQSLSRLLRSETKKKVKKKDFDDDIEDLQLTMLKIQQAVYHRKERVIIVFEGFDAAGKGGTIRAITEKLDPRSFKVVPIGAPKKSSQGKHYLYRFWRKLPAPGYITIFDRSWYGRVLVEKVEGLTPVGRIKDAYTEINEFEAMLTRDGIHLIKIFLAVSKEEQLERFEERLTDVFKQWKISEDDIRARKHWKKYVHAVDTFLKHNDTSWAPWYLISSDSKPFARKTALEKVTKQLSPLLKGFESIHLNHQQKKLMKELRSS